ncbi:MAG: hypothetical protein ACE5IK_11900 [Acidobacteriota bacterium]
MEETILRPAGLPARHRSPPPSPGVLRIVLARPAGFGFTSHLTACVAARHEEDTRDLDDDPRIREAETSPTGGSGGRGSIPGGTTPQNQTGAGN